LLTIGSEIHLDIDSLTYGGEGLGRYNGIVIFVPDSVRGDSITARVVSVKKYYARAIITNIIKPSQYRVEPFCSLANLCGGCQWQHVDYDEQLNAKMEIVKESFKKIAHIDIPIKNILKNETHKQFRSKIQYPVQQTKTKDSFAIGYYTTRTHNIVNIESCPIQPKIIDNITNFIRKKLIDYKLTAYNEKRHFGLIRHLVFRYSQSKKNLLLIFVINDNKIHKALKELCKLIKIEFPQIEGILANFNTSKTNSILSFKMFKIIGNDYIFEELESKLFRISANSFFQVNPQMAIKMFNVVKTMIESRTNNVSILDVYSGVGAFAIWMLDLAKKIIAIEENPSAIKDLEYNVKLRSAENKISWINDDAEIVLSKLVNENQNFDVIILDPPRKGCTKNVINAVANLCREYIIYVSCNPNTLARDAKMLIDMSFNIEEVQIIDMFTFTYHIESIVMFKKN